MPRGVGGSNLYSPAQGPVRGPTFLSPRVLCRGGAPPPRRGHMSPPHGKSHALGAGGRQGPGAERVQRRGEEWAPRRHGFVSLSPPGPQIRGRAGSPLSRSPPAAGIAGTARDGLPEGIPIGAGGDEEGRVGTAEDAQGDSQIGGGECLLGEGGKEGLL